MHICYNTYMQNASKRSPESARRPALLYDMLTTMTKQEYDDGVVERIQRIKGIDAELVGKEERLTDAIADLERAAQRVATGETFTDTAWLSPTDMRAICDSIYTRREKRAEIIRALVALGVPENMFEKR